MPAARRLALSLPAAALCAMIAGAPAPAAPPEAPPAERDAGEATPIAELIERLGAPDYHARQRAERRLAERDAELERLVKGPLDPAALDPEQRLRIAAILEDRFAGTPRAGLGVGLAPQPGPDGRCTGVELTQIVPDFPASKFLQQGDVLLSAAGVSLSGVTVSEANMNVRAAIVSHDPGDIIELALVRDGERIELDAPLGSLARLQNAAPLDARLLATGWGFRAQRLGLVRPDEAIDVASFADAGDADLRRVRRSLIVAGGVPEALDRAVDSVAPLARSDANTRLALRADAQVRNELNQQAAELRREAARTQSQFLDAQKLLRNGDLDEDRRQEVQERAARLQERLLELVAQMRDIDQRIRDLKTREAR